MTRRSAAAWSGLAAIIVLAGCAPLEGNAPPPTTTAEAEEIPAASLTGTLIFTRAGGAFEDETTFATSMPEGAERVVDEPPGCCPFVSPDGQRILVAAIVDDLVTTETFAIDGSDRRTKPSESPTFNLGPGPWSPDGSQVAFEGWDTTDPSLSGLYLGAPDTAEGLRRLTDQRDIPAAFSPTGDRVLFWRGPESTGSAPPIGELLTVSTIDGMIARVSPDVVGVPGYSAAWSPDGERIVFVDETGSIVVVAPDGSDPKAVWSSSEGRYAWTPSWSPDGEQIVFALNPSKNPYPHPVNVLVVMDAAGGELQLVSDTDDFKRNPLWITTE